MSRLLALTGVFLVALVGAGSAQALSEPASTKLRQLSQAELKALIADIDAQGLNTSGSANVKTGVGRMQLAAGRFGTLGAVSTIGVVAAGSVIVWRIADGLGLGGYVYRKITGEAYGSAPPIDIRWIYRDTGGGTGFSFLPGNTPGPGWSIEGYGTTILYGTGGNSNCQDLRTVALTVSGTEYGPLSATNCGVGTSYLKQRSMAQMQAAIAVTPSDASEFASPPAGATTVTAGTADPTTLTDPELEAALDAIDPNPGTAGTAVEEDTAVAILDELDPGWDEGLLLQPLPNETYTTYITRLQDAGYVGTATTTVLTTVEPGYGPEAVVRVITTPVGGTTTVYDPLNWPSPSPTIQQNTAITIRYNPDTAPEAPTTQTPTTIAVPPTTIPSAPALDFSPLTDIDFGCKFPYGFLCYAVDFSEQFDVAADAPTFTFDMEMDVALGEFDLGTYTVDLEVMDAWMALWRDILSVVLVVGAIYFVATRLLGFKAGGDPGAAMDDVL